MKTIYSILLIAIPLISNAQPTKEGAIYGSGGIALGNYITFSQGGTYIFEEKISFEARFSTSFRHPYHLDEKEYPCTGFLSNNPCEVLHSIEFLTGKVKVLNKNKTIRLNLKAGLSIGNFYSYGVKQESKFGIIIEPTIEFPYLHFMGHSISVYFKGEGGTLAYGIKGGLMFGKLRPKKK